jgi:hypothetical protein
MLTRLQAGDELTAKEVATTRGCSGQTARKMLSILRDRHPQIRTRPEDHAARQKPRVSYFWLPEGDPDDRPNT